MIDARELRIGNWVKNIHSNQYKDVQVASSFFSNCEYSSVPYQINWIEPIPITEKWLEGFGFIDYEWCQDCAFIKNPNGGHIMVRLLKSGWRITLTIVRKDHKGHFTDGHKEIVKTGNIRHVHQLQNLYFALIGKELEIK